MRRLVLLVAGSTVSIVGLLAALGYGVWASITARQQDVVGDILAEQAGLVAGSVLLFVALLVIALAVFLGRYVAPARRLASEIDVIATVNPEHRVPEEGAPELRALAAAVNQLAGGHAALHRDIEEAARRSRADVEEERNRLAALMAELTHAVLVCNLAGRILLYNQAARELFGEETGGTFVGLGRSLFGLVDRDLVLHALAYVRELAERGDARPVSGFATQAAGRLVRAQLAPVRDREGAITGFVLTLEDVTKEAEVVDQRAALLRELVERGRHAVANIRAAVETMQDYGDVDREQQERFLGVIREEAASLSGLVGEALERSADLVREHWALDDMRARDLRSVISRALAAQPDSRVATDEAEDVWLRVDAHALAQTISSLAERLVRERGATGLVVEARRAGTHAAVDIRWAGTPLDAQTLRAWEHEALVRDGRPLPFSLRDVLDRHGAEAWSQRDGDGAVLRLLLPGISEPVHPDQAGPTPSPAERPALYDFDLFGRIEPESELEERRLADLSYTVFDTETTGLDPTQDELIAVGAVRIVNGRLLTQEAFDQLIDPRRPVSDASLRIHGISTHMLQGQPPIEAVLPRFAGFAEDTVLVGHNVAFDMRFLAEKEAVTGVRFTQPVLDTLLLSPVAHPDLEDHSLEAIAQRLGVSVIGRHTALGDAILTAELFLRLLRVLERRGVLTLGDALAAARRTYQARVSESLYTPPPQR